MTNNQTKVIISAEDKTGTALASVRNNLKAMEGSFAGLDAAAARIPLLGSALVAAFGSVSLTGLVKTTIDAADNLNDLSQRIGINIKDLATWELAARQSGTSLESVAKGVKGLSTYMVENGAALRAAGINATDANGALIELADLFQAMPDGIEKTNLAVKLFGKAGMDMIPMLNLGSAGLAEAAAKAEDYGRRMAELAPQADAFNDQLEELALQSRAAGINITSYLLPGLIGMATWFNDLAAGGDRAATALEFMSEKSPLFAALVKMNKLVNGGDARSQAFTGKKDALGLPLDQRQKDLQELAAFDAATDAYLKQRDARRRAASLTDKDGKPKAAKGAKAGKTDLERMIELGEKNLAAGTDSEEEQRLLAMRRNAKDAADEYARLNTLMAATPSGQLEKARNEMEFLAVALEKGTISEAQFLDAVGMHYGKAEEKLGEMGEFAKEAARNMQDAMADFFFDGMQGKFENMADSFKKTLDRMVANAVAADLSRRLLGDFGKTGEIGGWVGKLLGGGGGPEQLSGPGSDGGGFLSGLLKFLPGFAEGTPYVPRTGLALIHQGERIIPAEQNRAGFGGSINITINGSNNAPDVRRAAGQGAREALAAFSGAKRYA